MNATKHLETLETVFRVMCESRGLELDKLYEMQEQVRPELDKFHDAHPSTEANQYNAGYYTEILTQADDPFALVSMTLSLWKIGGHPEGVLRASQAVCTANVMLANVLHRLGL